jgi:hypothetical protein
MVEFKLNVANVLAKPVCRHYLRTAFFNYRTIFILVLSALMMACASEQKDTGDQPIEPSFQERVTECSKIADRGERDRCLYGN